MVWPRQPYKPGNALGGFKSWGSHVDLLSLAMQQADLNHRMAPVDLARAAMDQPNFNALLICEDSKCPSQI